MKKFLVFYIALFYLQNSFGYLLVSSKELGSMDAKNQTVVVKCTTDVGDVSDETCTVRRYVSCEENNCDSWQPWYDLYDSSNEYSDWREAVIDCCEAKGLR